jgi:hypothetical protein
VLLIGLANGPNDPHAIHVRVDDCDGIGRDVNLAVSSFQTRQKPLVIIGVFWDGVRVQKRLNTFALLKMDWGVKLFTHGKKPLNLDQRSFGDATAPDDFFVFVRVEHHGQNLRSVPPVDHVNSDPNGERWHVKLDEIALPDGFVVLLPAHSMISSISHGLYQPLVLAFQRT